MTGIEAEVVVPLAVAVISATPATLAVVVSVRKVRNENVADHGRVRERLEELTATVASAEASNTAAHERLTGAVETVAAMLDRHATDEEELHGRLRSWLDSHHL